MMASDGSTGNECLTDYTTCDVHKKEQIVKFCKSHESLICKICEITSHISCVKVTSKDKAKETNQKNSIDAFLRKFQTLEKDLKCLKTNEETNKKTVLNKLQECHKDVKETRKKLDSHFDKLEKELTDSIDDVGKKLLGTTDSRIKAFDHYIEEIEKEIKKLQMYQSTDDDEVIFVGQTKSMPVFGNYEEVYANLKSKTTMRYPEVLVNPGIQELFLKLQNIGYVVESVDLFIRRTDHQYSLPPGSNLSDFPLKELDTTLDNIQATLILGSTFLPDGRLVLSAACPGGLFMYSDDGIKQSTLRTEGCQVHKLAAISNCLVVGTVPAKHEIHYFIVSDLEICFDRKIKSTRPCYGIDVHNDKLYVTCHGGNCFMGDGEIVVMDMDGKPLVRYMKSIADGGIFNKPADIHIDKVNSDMFIADRETGKIVFMSENGRVSTLVLENRAQEICQWNQHTLVVAGLSKLCLVKKYKCASVLNMQHLISTISYNLSDSALFVGIYGYNKSRIYRPIY